MKFKELETELVSNLEKLKATASQKGVNLLKKKCHKSSGILVSTAFSQPRLSAHYSSLISDTIPFCRKYEGLKPKSVEELIRYCGGLSTAINNIQYAYEFELPMRMQVDDDLEFLLFSLESVLLKARSATSQTKKWIPFEIAQEQGRLNLFESQYKTRLPMCAVCWKRTFSSSYYCKDHHSIHNKKAYNSAVRKVLSFTERHSSNSELRSFANAYRKRNGKQRGLASQLFNMLNDSVPTVVGVLNDQTDEQWESYAESIITYTKSNYPTSFHRLQQSDNLTQFSNFNSLLRWGFMVIESLDDSEGESSRWEASEELNHFNNGQLRFAILSILARYEATQRIYKPLKSGPMKGYGADVERREILCKLYRKQLEDNGRVNLSQIARAMGLSRQRVSVLVKELQLM